MLVVDDSMLFREVIVRGISADPYIEVVAVASNPFEARDRILEVNPDVVTCDVEMPGMNGIDFVRLIMSNNPVPVIMVSSISSAVFDAMGAGAVDFVVKPGIHNPKGVEGFIYDLTMKIKVASISKIKQIKPVSKDVRKVQNVAQSNKIIAIGASTGGTEAIFSIIKNLPQEIPGIVIVQHIPPVFSGMFAERLNLQTKLSVKEGETGDYLERGKVVIAPGDRHMGIKKIGGRYKIECFKGQKVSGHCPSVDVLFESVAKEAGEHAIGVILTGMGADGAKGLLAMKAKGARTVGQDEQSSVVYGMPKVAFDLGAVERQLALTDIPQALCSMLD